MFLESGIPIYSCSGKYHTRCPKIHSERRVTGSPITWQVFTLLFSETRDESGKELGVTHPSDMWVQTDHHSLFFCLANVSAHSSTEISLRWMWRYWGVYLTLFLPIFPLGNACNPSFILTRPLLYGYTGAQSSSINNSDLRISNFSVLQFFLYIRSHPWVRNHLEHHHRYSDYTVLQLFLICFWLFSAPWAVNNNLLAIKDMSSCQENNWQAAASPPSPPPPPNLPPSHPPTNPPNNYTSPLIELCSLGSPHVWIISLMICAAIAISVNKQLFKYTSLSMCTPLHSFYSINTWWIHLLELQHPLRQGLAHFKHSFVSKRLELHIKMASLRSKWLHIALI